MPTWKIKGYWFYFKTNDLTKNKPAHIHVETSRGEIQFWLEKTDTKSKDEIKVKKIKGQVSEPEQNETEKINIFVPNNPKNSEQELLSAENKILQEKLKQLEQENQKQKKSINNLQINLKRALNDKENLTKQLIQTQNEKETLLKLLSTDLKNQYENLIKQGNKQQTTPELHQQLIAQIEIKLK